MYIQIGIFSDYANSDGSDASQVCCECIEVATEEYVNAGCENRESSYDTSPK